MDVLISINLPVVDYIEILNNGLIPVKVDSIIFVKNKPKTFLDNSVCWIGHIHFLVTPEV